MVRLERVTAMRSHPFQSVYQLIKQRRKQLGQSGAEQGGIDILRGFAKGVENKNEQNSIFSNIKSFGSQVISTLKTALGERSPSKYTEEAGIYLLQGFKIGIKKETPALLKQIDTLGEAVVMKIKTAFTTDAVRTVENQIERTHITGKNSWTDLYSKYAKESVEKVVEELPAVLYSGAKRVKTNGANKPKTISVFSSSSTSAASSALSNSSVLSAEKTALAESKVASVITEIKAILSDIRANISEIKLDIYDSTNQSRAIRSQYRTLDERAAQLDNRNKNVTVNQYNTYSQAHSRYELYKSKQQTYAAVRLANATS